MRKVLEVLRLAHEHGRSQREIATSLALSQSTVNDYLRRFEASGVAWPLPREIDETALDAQLFARPSVPAAHTRPVPDWPTVHRELRRTGVTLHLLWLEYKQATPDGWQYTQFCHHYHTWAAHLDPVLRQVHKAGERVFVDYAGPTIDIVEPSTGEVRAAQLFIGALGASNYFYAEATWTQTLPDWIASHVRMFEDFGGTTALTVPDNLRAGVAHASFYEPEINPTYQDFATHYATVILPTRVARPRDKAKVESAVQVVERGILAPLRDYRFTSLAELNAEITQLRHALNDRPFQKLAGTRRLLFETLDRPALRPLPTTRYEFAEWKTARVNIDYHLGQGVRPPPRSSRRSRTIMHRLTTLARAGILVTGTALGAVLGYEGSALLACQVLWPASNLCGLPGVFVGLPIGAVAGLWLARRLTRRPSGRPAP